MRQGNAEIRTNSVKHFLDSSSRCRWLPFTHWRLLTWEESERRWKASVESCREGSMDIHTYTVIFLLSCILGWNLVFPSHLSNCIHWPSLYRDTANGNWEPYFVAATMWHPGLWPAGHYRGAQNSSRRRLMELTSMVILPLRTLSTTDPW